jgi:hypothetical protein
MAERGINGLFGVKMRPCGISFYASLTTKPHHVMKKHFDGIFWIIETLALVLGIWILRAKHSAEWIPFLVIEYCWAMDNLRHNRP